MKSFATFVFASLCLFGSAAGACSFAEMERFTPGTWEWHDITTKSGETVWEAIPAPVIKKITIKRGTAAAGMSCDDAGIMTVEVTLPKSSSYNIRDFGLYFRQVGGTAPQDVIYSIPVTGAVKGKTSTFTFVWLDGATSEQVKMDFTLETFFVTGDFSVGPSTFTKIVTK